MNLESKTYSQIQAYVEAKHSGDIWNEFNPAWRAFPRRLAWCLDHSQRFTESLTRSELGRDEEDREAFSFFVVGISAIETFCYAVYILGALFEPAFFPSKIKRDLRNISPESTAERFSEAFTGESLTEILRSTRNDATYQEWKRIRNGLIHCSSPGRILYFSGRPDEWDHMDFTIPISAETTEARFSWLSQSLSRGIDATNLFLQTHDETYL